MKFMKKEDNKLFLKSIDKFRADLNTIEISLNTQTINDKKNSTSLHEALYRIKNWTLQYEPSIVPFCEILSTPFITPLLNNIHSDNTLSAFAQPNLQVNKKKDLLEDILHKSLIAVTLPTENFNITHKLTNNIYPNNNILNLPNPFIVQNEKNNILKPYNFGVEKIGLDISQLESPLWKLDLRIPNFNSPTKYQQSINEHWYSVFPQNMQRLERLNTLPIEKQQLYLTKKNLVIKIINKDNSACHYTVDPRDIEKHTFQNGQLIVAIKLPKGFYDTHIEAAISTNYKDKQGVGGRNNLLKEKQLYKNEFTRLKKLYPHLEDGKISTKIWQEHKGNHLSSLSKEHGRETLRKWQKRQNLGVLIITK